ncbi:uncharacterized protein LOC120812464 [Gasterosteus aculeatus]
MEACLVESFPERNSGPLIHLLQLKKRFAVSPLEASSAGFSFVLTYLHCDTSVASLTKEILFATKSSCIICLAGRTNGTRNPKGSYTEPTTDRMPRLVYAHEGAVILNVNTSVSTHQCNPSALSIGRLWMRCSAMQRLLGMRGFSCLKEGG